MLVLYNNGFNLLVNSVISSALVSLPEASTVSPVGDPTAVVTM